MLDPVQPLEYETGLLALPYRPSATSLEEHAHTKILRPNIPGQYTNTIPLRSEG